MHIPECRRLARWAVILALGLLPLAAPLATDLSERHRPSGENSTFWYSGDDIAGYVAQNRAMIARTRTDLPGENPHAVIEGNAPFLWQPSGDCPAGRQHPYRNGIVLAHGLTDSPYLMRDLGEFFRNRCFLVFSVLLPGHGTRPGDLLEVHWTDWARAVRYGADALARQVDQLYLGGFSTGATAALYQAQRDNRVAGLFLFAPAIAISSLAPVACLLDTLGSLWRPWRWLEIQPDQDPYKYESFPANAACQIQRLTREIDAIRHQPIQIPLFTAASLEDATVKTQATLQVVKAARHPLTRLVLFGEQGPREVSGATQVVSVADPARRILGSAHTAIVKPPWDPHYGESGAYRLCGTYLDKKQSYRLCKAGQADYLGEISRTNRNQGVIQRLTYNPRYQVLLESLTEFLAGLEQTQ